MKVNVVKLDANGTSVRELVDTSEMLHLEIELDMLTYRIDCGEAQAWPGQWTGLRVAGDGRLAVRPIASNVIEINQL